MARFSGTRVIVTGGASGIGRELVSILIDEGGHVVVLDRDVAGIAGVAGEIRVDLGDSQQLQTAMSSAVADLGGVDVLCNNAGIGSTKSALDCPLDEWQQVFRVNVEAVFLGVQAVLPTMLEQGSGVIVNTASAAGLIGLPERAAYCASKAAVIGFTKQVAIEYAGRGIRSNCVCPGTVDSPWVGRLLADSDDPVERRRALIARQPMGRLGTPTEIAQAIAFLASPESAFMTGSELVIDGGIVAG